MSKSSRSTKPTVDVEAEASSKPTASKLGSIQQRQKPDPTKSSRASKPKSDAAPKVIEQPSRQPKASTRLGEIMAMLRTKRGASIEEIAKAVGWQRHSVHGLISGNIRKKQGLNVVSEMVDGVRVYRIVK